MMTIIWMIMKILIVTAAGDAAATTDDEYNDYNYCNIHFFMLLFHYVYFYA